MKPIRLEQRQRFFLGIAGASFALVLFVRFVCMPLMARIGGQRATLADLRVKTSEARMRVGRLPQEERALEQARQRYQNLERRVGGGQSIARILETLSQQAKDRRLKLTVVQPREEQREPHVMPLGDGLTLREVPLTLQLTGRYRQLGEFLGELSEAPFLSSVSTLRIVKSDTEPPNLKADLVLTVYLAQESPS